MSKDARVQQNAEATAGSIFVSTTETGSVDIYSRRGAEGAKIDEYSGAACANYISLLRLCEKTGF